MCTGLLPPGDNPIAVKILIIIIIIIIIYLLTLIGLSPGGSSTVHIYTKTMQRTTQLI
jgi:hypothetical protein